MLPALAALVIAALATKGARRRRRGVVVSVEGNDCDALIPDPSGKNGRPNYANATQVGRPVTDWSPNCVRWLAIPVLQTDPSGNVLVFTGLDALGQWWWGSFAVAGMKDLAPGDEPGTDDTSWFDKAVAAFVTFVVPIVAGVVATAAPGVGTLFGKVILAWRDMALGQSITAAVLNRTRNDFATGSTSALSAFDQGRQAVEKGLTDAQIADLSKAIPSAVTSKIVKDAFYKAVTLVRGKQVQDLTVAALSTAALSVDEVARLQLALKWGAPLADVMTGLRGQPGDKLLAGTSHAAALFVQKNVQHPDAIAVAVSDPKVLSAIVQKAPSPAAKKPLGVVRQALGKAGSGKIGKVGKSSGKGGGGAGVIAIAAVGLGALFLLKGKG